MALHFNIGFKDLGFEMQQEILSSVMEYIKEDVEFIAELQEQAEENAKDLFGDEVDAEKIEFEFQTLLEEAADDRINREFRCVAES